MLYLVHHADALDSDVDPQRPLSPQGRDHAAALARRLAARGVRPVAIWHSGKLRARQTAEACLFGCNPSAEFKAIRGLQPTDPPDWIRDFLTGETRDVMIVSHFPLLPRLLAVLTEGRGSGVEASFPLHGAVALEPEEDLWKELWRE
jgi:phosphohistidine phosphatase